MDTMQKMKAEGTERLICTIKELLKVLEDGYVINVNNPELRELYIKTIQNSEDCLTEEGGRT